MNRRVRNGSPAARGTSEPGALDDSTRATRGEPPRRRRRRRRLGLGLGLAALLLGAAVGLAPAGQQLVDDQGANYGWDLDLGQPNVVNGKVTFFLNPAGTSDNISGPLGDLAAVRAGILAWEVPGTRIRFAEDTSRPASGRNSLDRVNYVGWTTNELGPFTFAATFPTRDGSRFTDTDVLFNDRDFTWNTRSPGVSSQADIQSLMAHEWGHALGADHIPLRTSTMYFATDRGAILWRSLAADDIALVGAMYPSTTFDRDRGSIAGSVTRAGASDSRGIHVVAISLATAEPAASTLTAPSGAFRIDGLVPGAYRLVAAPTLPLAPQMNEFWHSASTSFLPSIRRKTPSVGTSSNNPGAVLPVSVVAGEVSTGANFSVANVASPFEPDNDADHATLIQLGDGMCGRLESRNDVDYFAFDGLQDQIVSIAIYAWNLGSEADPAIEVSRVGGPLVVPEIDDARRLSEFRNLPEGPDLDVRIHALRLPADDRYYVRVRNDAGSASNNSFYALMITPAGDSPSAALSKVSATAERIDADGVSTTTIVIEPLRETGQPVGSGADVTLSHDGAGSVGEVSDEGDGTYTAVVEAPRTLGDDVFSVRIESETGTALLSNALRLVYLGPADAAQTAFRAVPRRIDADGVATSVIQMRPRDANGEELGTGRALVLSASGGGDAALGSVTDLGVDYAASLTAASDTGSVALTLTVDGVTLSPPLEVGFGFPLLPVLTQAGADAAIAALTPELPKKSSKRIADASRWIEKALPDATAGEGSAFEKFALSRTVKVTKALRSARNKAGGPLDDLIADDELARAVRDAALAAIGRAELRVQTKRSAQKISDARARISKGQTKFNDGRPDKAAAQWLAAFKKVYKLALDVD